MSEPLDQDTIDKIDQQRRVISQTKNAAGVLLNALDEVQKTLNTYNRLGLSDDEVLQPESFNGSGTNIQVFRDAVTSLEACHNLLTQGHGTNLERLVR